MKLFNIVIPLETFLKIRDQHQHFIVFDVIYSELKKGDLIRFMSGDLHLLTQVLHIVDKEEWLVEGNVFISFKVLG